MPRLLAALLALSLCLPLALPDLAQAARRRSATRSRVVHVRGHVRKDGVYVPAHNRTAGNKSKRDNWSSQGNSNPYTGATGKDY